MKRILITLIALAIFSGCGIFQKSDRNRLRDKSEVSRSASEQIGKNDQTILVTREKVDTSILIPERRISTAATATKDIDGSYFARFDTTGLDAMIRYNQATGKFNFDLFQPAELKQIYLDRIITESRNITEAAIRNNVTTEKKDVNQKLKVTKPTDPVITTFRVLSVFFIILFIVLAYRRIKRA